MDYNCLGFCLVKITDKNINALVSKITKKKMFVDAYVISTYLRTIVTMFKDKNDGLLFYQIKIKYKSKFSIKKL